MVEIGHVKVNMSDPRLFKEWSIDIIDGEKLSSDFFEVEWCHAGMLRSVCCEHLEAVAIRLKRSSPSRFVSNLNSIPVWVGEVDRTRYQMICCRMRIAVDVEAGSNARELFAIRDMDGNVIESNTFGQARLARRST